MASMATILQPLHATLCYFDGLSKLNTTTSASIWVLFDCGNAVCIRVDDALYHGQKWRQSLHGGSTSPVLEFTASRMQSTQTAGTYRLLRRQ
jgi:hypothetical protein